MQMIVMLLKFYQSNLCCPLTLQKKGEKTLFPMLQWCIPGNESPVLRNLEALCLILTNNILRYRLIQILTGQPRISVFLINVPDYSSVSFFSLATELFLLGIEMHAWSCTSWTALESLRYLIPFSGSFWRHVILSAKLLTYWKTLLHIS